MLVFVSRFHWSKGSEKLPALVRKRIPNTANFLSVGSWWTIWTYRSWRFPLILCSDFSWKWNCNAEKIFFFPPRVIVIFERVNGVVKSSLDWGVWVYFLLQDVSSKVKSFWQGKTFYTSILIGDCYLPVWHKPPHSFWFT